MLGGTQDLGDRRPGGKGTAEGASWLLAQLAQWADPDRGQITSLSLCPDVAGSPSAGEEHATGARDHKTQWRGDSDGTAPASYTPQQAGGECAKTTHPSTASAYPESPRPGGRMQASDALGRLTHPVVLPEAVALELRVSHDT